MGLDHNRHNREALVHLVHSAGIFGLRDDDLERDFIAGKIDPELEKIGVDSLSEMELCIAIENEWGVSIVPAELGSLKTLNGILQRVDALRPR
jgi:acyl carrier protein